MSTAFPARKTKQQQAGNKIVEVKGVRLKHFEQVLIKLLRDNALEPRYISLPSTERYNQVDWDGLPGAARVHGTLPGQLAIESRAKRKEDQIQSMMRCIFALLPNHNNVPKDYTIVDFGGGSGHLSIPLALLLPMCTVVVVDLKQKSLDFLHVKARACIGDHPTPPVTEKTKTLQPTAIPNLFTFSGDIESYKNPFHMGVALHVCGEATDVVLRKCAHNLAHVVVAPCCVGKLSSVKRDPYIYHATSQNAHTIQYPQSKQFQQCLQCNSIANDWNALAKAADYNEYLDMDDRRNASKRTAKGLLELDRQLYLREAFSYQTALTRMEPPAASPKNDILMGIYCLAGEVVGTTTDPLWTFESAESPDPIVVWTKAHLLHPGAIIVETVTSQTPEKKPNTAPGKDGDGVDWTREEEQLITCQLIQHFSLGAAPNDGDEKETFVFPTGMGGRRRKLIHFVADQLGLAHWCVGNKHADKTVAVRRRHVQAAESAE